MKQPAGTFVLMFLLVFGLGASLAHAHRVGVFCWVEGNKLHTQSSFQPGGPVKGGEVQMVLPASGRVLATGKTDARGEYTFALPAAARKEKDGLRILLRAGAGHKGQWDVPAEDYMDGDDPAFLSRPTVADHAVLVNPETANGDAGTKGISPEALQKLFDQELDRKLAPIKRSLAEMQEKNPSVSEILGGIGYIFGIMGLVLYFKSKKTA